MWTADTITDEQIHQLRERLRSDISACDVALRGKAHPSFLDECRARCAEILNARARGGATEALRSLAQSLRKLADEIGVIARGAENGGQVITADTITDEQILALNNDPQSSLTTRAWCVAAMVVTRNSKKAEALRMKARVRCAEILNARKDQP
jgi:hypothetical protein